MNLPDQYNLLLGIDWARVDEIYCSRHEALNKASEIRSDKSKIIQTRVQLDDNWEWRVFYREAQIPQPEEVIA